MAGDNIFRTQISVPDDSIRQSSINNLTNVVAATNEYVLTKDTATGNAIFKPSAGASGVAQAFRVQRVSLSANTILTASQCLRYQGGIEINNTISGTLLITIPSVSNFTDGDYLYIENRFNSLGNINVDGGGVNIRHIDGTTTSNTTLTPNSYIILQYNATPSLYVRKL